MKLLTNEINPTNAELERLVMARVPFQNRRRILLAGFKPSPTTSRKYQDNHPAFYDVTKQVRAMVKRGTLRLVRRYGYGHSRRAGHTIVELVK